MKLEYEKPTRSNVWRPEIASLITIELILRGFYHKHKNKRNNITANGFAERIMLRYIDVRKQNEK